MPNTVKANGFLLHQFVVPGFDFMFVVGGNAPSWADNLCLVHSYERPIMVSERSDARRFAQALKAMDVADAADEKASAQRVHRHRGR